MCLERQVKIFLNIQIDHIMLTKHWEEERLQSGFAFEVHILHDTANRSTSQAYVAVGWVADSVLDLGMLL